jgi:hypothetical protein
VVTAYRDPRAIGVDDLSAFHSCSTLYRIHHPESSLSEARRLVAEWIDHHVIRMRLGWSAAAGKRSRRHLGYAMKALSRRR